MATFPIPERTVDGLVQELDPNFSMGVAVPVPNYRFIFPTRKTGTLFATNLTAGITNLAAATFVYINETTPDIRNLAVAFDEFDYMPDKIILGPSTNPNYLGAMEEFYIKGFEVGDTGGTSGYIIEIYGENGQNFLKFSYENGDPFSIVGGKFPEGWTTSNIWGSNNDGIIVYPLDQFYEISSKTRGGKSWYDNFGFSFKAHNSDETWPGVSITSSIEYDLRPSTVHRLGVGFIRTKPLLASPDPEMIFKAFDGTGWFSNIFLNEELDNEVDETESSALWQEVWTTGVWTSDDGHLVSSTETNLTPGNPMTFEIAMKAKVGGGSTILNSKIAYLYMEHAAGTTTEEDGCYRFTEVPDLGSISYTFIESYNRQDKIHKGKRFNWTGKFSDVSTEFFKNLMVLDYHQELGQKINFHMPEAEVSTNNELPTIIRGNFNIRDIAQNSWDNKKISFTLEFTEE